jgi:LEA14-like dessication related protein
MVGLHADEAARWTGRRPPTGHPGLARKTFGTARSVSLTMDRSRLRSTFLGSTLRILATVVLLVVVVIGLGFLLGVFGVPAVEDVQNRFGPVNESTTTIETEMVVSNPNPIGASLGGVTVDYTVFMNDVEMATGQKDGVSVGTGNSTLQFQTQMANEKIPAWWYSHIENREQTEVLVDASISSATLGGTQVDLPQKQQIETDIVSAFNSTETRPVNASQPFPEDPALYVNRTNGSWGYEDLTREQTPIDLSFDVYNPKPWPYAISEVGYTITMNDATVGEGATRDLPVVPPGSAQTIETRTAIQNENLDEWWVTHLEANQVTELRIDFYMVVDPQTSDQFAGTDEVRIPLDAVDYERTIETDMFGTKNQSGPASQGDRNDDSGDSTGGLTDDGASTTRSTGSSTGTESPRSGPTETPISTPGIGDSTDSDDETPDSTTTTEGGLVDPDA